MIRQSTDREALELALIENIQRQDLNCIDEACAYFQLMQDFSLTQEEIGHRVGKNRTTIANYLRLLHLPEVIIQDLKNQTLTFGHGKALLGLEDVASRLQARTQIIEKRLSVRETEALVEALKTQNNHTPFIPQAHAPQTPLHRRLFTLSQELTRQWSTKIEMKGNENRGKIVIHYATRPELERLIETLKNKNI